MNESKLTNKPTPETDTTMIEADDKLEKLPDESESDEVTTAQKAYDEAPKRNGKVGRKTNAEKKAAKELKIKTLKSDIMREHPAIFAKHENAVEAVNDTVASSKDTRLEDFLSFKDTVRKSKEPNTDYNEVLEALVKYKFKKVDNLGNYVLEFDGHVLQYNGYSLPEVDGELLCTYINDDSEDMLGKILKALKGE